MPAVNRNADKPLLQWRRNTRSPHQHRHGMCGRHIRERSATNTSSSNHSRMGGAPMKGSYCHARRCGCQGQRLLLGGGGYNDVQYGIRHGAQSCKCRMQRPISAARAQRPDRRRHAANAETARAPSYGWSHVPCYTRMQPYAHINEHLICHPHRALSIC